MLVLKKGKKPIIFSGSSMGPLLRDNDALYFKKTALNRTKINDLLFIKNNDDLFVHRVIYKTTKYLISKGDNNLISDGKIHPAQIVGKLAFFIRNKQKIFIEDIYLLQSTVYLKEIIKINILFTKNHIDFLFLKGLILHLFLTKDYPKRLYNDCDVLIGKKNFRKVDDILVKDGYKRQIDIISSQNNSGSGVPQAVSYIKIINNFPVVFDIHTELVFLMTQIKDISPLYPKKKVIQMSDNFLKQKKIIKIAANNFPVLSENNMLIYLALHFFHHNFRGIFRLEFLHALVTKNRPNNLVWTDIIDKIRYYNIANFVFPVFFLLKKYFKTPLPTIFMNSLLTENKKRFKKIILTKIFNDQNRGEGGIRRFLNIFYFSSSPIYKKMLIIFNRQFLFFVFLILRARLFSFLKNRQ